MKEQYTVFRFVSCLNEGSIGRTAEQISQLVQKKGWRSFIAYSRMNLGSTSEVYRVDSRFSTLLHALLTRLFDMCGYGSYFTTKKMIRKIKQIKPDLIHLHIFHNYDINIKLLFEYLSKSNIPVVWTHHDCWGYTGHCAHYAEAQCDKWITGCEKCPIYKGFPKSWFWDGSRRNYKLKKKCFNLIPSDKMVMVAVSEFIKNDLGRSFLKKYQIKRIYNAIDTNTFRPIDAYNEICEKYGIEKGSIILAGFATNWSEKKGLYDYYKLRDVLPSSYVIMLVGVSAELLGSLPKGIIGIKKTDSVEDLVKLYSAASIVMNLSSEESFGKTTPEGMACGTPGIVYNCTASPELIDEKTGIVVEKGDIESIVEAIKTILSWNKEITSQNCINRVKMLFDANTNWNEYISLYEELINKK